jgi:hypothetical protein
MLRSASPPEGKSGPHRAKRCAVELSRRLSERKPGLEPVSKPGRRLGFGTGSKHVLVLAPTSWDREELASPRYRDRFRFTFVYEPWLRLGGRPSLWRLLRPRDPFRWVERLARRFRSARLDGVLGTDEFLSCALASLVSRRLGLPGPAPEAVLACQHKHLSRSLQREVAPESVPRFVLLDAGASDPARDVDGIGWPLFVKPVRGTSSVLARAVRDPDDLRSMLRFSRVQRFVAGRLMAPFARLAERLAGLSYRVEQFLGEGLLRGQLVTVEGFTAGGRSAVLGVTDSVTYPGTVSFRRFEFPSHLPNSAQLRLGELACRIVECLGLDQTLWNVEFFHDPVTDRSSLVEVNPRMAYQFADLYEKVEDRNGYDVALAIATGAEPQPIGRGAFAVAASFVFRSFRDARVVRMPGAGEVAALRRAFPDARLHVDAREGTRLSDREVGVESYRYAILNLGGRDAGDLYARFERARRMLTFVLDPPADVEPVGERVSAR